MIIKQSREYGWHTLDAQTLQNAVYWRTLISHQIGISIVFTHARLFYLTYAYKHMGKINQRTVARRTYASCTSIRDAIIMLKCSYYVASKRIQDFLEGLAYFMFSNKKSDI